MMITSLSQLDLSQQYSYADYLAWQLTERIEILKGYIKQMAAPAPMHQQVSTQLVMLLANHLKLNKKGCKIFHAPFDVRLIKNPLGTTDKEIYTVVQPDLCIICDKSKIDSRGCLGAPDLIIEILSPSNAKTDLQDKFALYQENLVPEYWIVFPNEKIIQKFILQQEKYYLKAIYEQNDKAVPDLFTDLEIDLKEVFEDI